MNNLKLIVLLLFTLMACKNEKQDTLTPKTIGLLTISTDQPQAGETVDLTYKNNDVTEAFYSYIVGTKNYPVDIDFKTSENEIKSSIKIPDSADAIAFIFKIGDDYDANNEQGYVMPLYNNNGEQIPGSNSSTAFFKIRYGSNYGIKAKDADVVESIKTDLTANPNLKDEWETTYLQLAYHNNKEEGQQLIDTYLENLSAKTKKSEKDYMSMMNLYSVTAEKAKLDSIKTVIIEKFPDSNTADYAVVTTFRAESDLDKKKSIFENFKERKSELGNWGNYMADNLAQLYFAKGDLDNFEKYISMVEDKNNRASTLNNLAWPLAEDGKNLDEAEKISKTSLDLITTLQENPTDKPEYLTQNQYEKRLKSSYKMYADTYALILFKQGKIKEAITYQEKAHDPKAQDAEANARYISYLMADKQYETVLKKASEFITLGNGNADTKAAYKTAYLKVNPNSKDVEVKIKALEKVGYDKSVAEIKSKILDKAAPQFTLKDTEGKAITLSDFKGKIVILDFWATWCGPCKASFPGMQKVVTKYKDDKNVVLLFVDTFERSNTREKDVENFIAKHKYDFHVVYDNEIKDSRGFEVADKYEVEGIPTKAIIGKDGRLKFKSVGFGGSTDKLVDEMDIMISLLKS